MLAVRERGRNCCIKNEKREEVQTQPVFSWHKEKEKKVELIISVLLRTCSDSSESFDGFSDMI